MKKMSIIIALALVCFIPNVAKAEELKLIDEVTKYFKTIESADPNQRSSSQEPITIEISEEEYYSFNPDVIPAVSTTVYTEYKKLTTTLWEVDGYYRYQVELDWRNMPKVRSYDIIGIGFFSSVKMSGNFKYETHICRHSGCTIDRTHTPKNTSTGVSVVYKLPTDSIILLTSVLRFDVKKNTDLTIIRQAAVGDYSHATKTVTLDQALKHNIGLSGIILDSSVSAKYDKIDEAEANWSGNW